MEQSAFDRFFDKVIHELERMNYPELVLTFHSKDVSKSLAGAIIKSYLLGTSPIMTAIIIWSLTMNMQVIPGTNRMVKN